MNEDWDDFMKKQCDKLWEETINELEKANMLAANSSVQSSRLFPSHKKFICRSTRERAAAEKAYKGILTGQDKERTSTTESEKKSKVLDIRRARETILRKHIQHRDT